ncbi:MAG: hypothetical protein CMH48_06835 [Muricauda sp.]|nr:hypothetical protein [Allomuricauda sp.]MAU26932.1 hypothetical protein [Allomuricauda sp.]MBC30546.1 hypothetical protein [Allomuricauda sp.]|tara:strand:+ start:537 stop:842 length:306 start_codon:yes stop_codon:yes gene_type:complete
MKVKEYFATLFIAAMFLPLIGAKSPTTGSVATHFDIHSIEFIETSGDIELGFDTAKYLPEGFNPYVGKVSVKSLNYIEDEQVELGFDTSEYLPEGFDPYKK